MASDVLIKVIVVTRININVPAILTELMEVSKFHYVIKLSAKPI